MHSGRSFDKVEKGKNQVNGLCHVIPIVMVKIQLGKENIEMGKQLVNKIFMVVEILQVITRCKNKFNNIYIYIYLAVEEYMKKRLKKLRLVIGLSYGMDLIFLIKSFSMVNIKMMEYFAQSFQGFSILLNVKLIIYQNIQSGSGFYDDEGDDIKNGKLIEWQNDLVVKTEVSYKGENKNGKKIGLWDILFQADLTQSWKQMFRLLIEFDLVEEDYMMNEVKGQSMVDGQICLKSLIKIIGQLLMVNIKMIKKSADGILGMGSKESKIEVNNIIQNLHQYLVVGENMMKNVKGAKQVIGLSCQMNLKGITKQFVMVNITMVRELGNGKIRQFAEKRLDEILMIFKQQDILIQIKFLQLFALLIFLTQTTQILKQLYLTSNSLLTG
ncbi:unnamed protein product [Paramecium octaurelia]|uniref:Uncharacterized protein n=1 Tax=Paramecium octaurelia TaxID=43137 RepID=A0A8S1YLH1_PAROT|nr:unnamed protein product [Paramecium octaurelia]